MGEAARQERLRRVRAASPEGASSHLPGCPPPEPAGWGQWEPGAAAAGAPGLGTCGPAGRLQGSFRAGPAPRSPAPALAKGREATPAAPDRTLPGGQPCCSVFAVPGLSERRKGHPRTESDGEKTGDLYLAQHPACGPCTPILHGTAQIQDQPGQGPPPALTTRSGFG